VAACGARAAAVDAGDWVSTWWSARAARAQQPVMPVVGFLYTGLPSDAAASRVPWSVEV
jgi:hypothetical protein